MIIFSCGYKETETQQEEGTDTRTETDTEEDAIATSISLSSYDITLESIGADTISLNQKSAQLLVS